MPAFIERLALRASGVHLLGGRPRRAIFWGENEGTRLTERFSLGIAEQARRAVIPGAAMPSRVEREDGIVLHIVHQQTILRFTYAKVRCGSLAGGRLRGY